MYICPMHPEIREEKPGNCPKCGMALERERPANLETEPDPEHRSMSRRFGWSAALSFLLWILAMGHPPESLANRWTQAALATPVVLWGAWPFFYRAYYSVIYRSLNMFTLIAMGIASAYLYSIALVLSSSSLPLYFESA